MGQKACFEELNYVQQMHHTRMSQEMQEFIGSQQQQLVDIGYGLSTAEKRLSAVHQEMKQVKQLHQEDTECLEESQNSTRSRLATTIASAVQLIPEDQACSEETWKCFQQCLEKTRRKIYQRTSTPIL